MDDVLNIFPPLKDYDTAARLLSQLCPDFVKGNVEADIGSPESFACLLYRNPDLFRCVEDARASGDPREFETIWKACIDYFSLENMTRRSLSCPDNVPLVLRRISANLTALVNGEAQQVIWTLHKGHVDDTSDIEKVDLGSFSETREPPSMLLHELGSFQSDHRLRDRVQRLFRKGHNTYVLSIFQYLTDLTSSQNRFLVNASATGKTRLLYEGLCQHWGLYITSHADEREARALEITLGRRIYDEGGLVRVLPCKSSMAFEPILAKNREIAARRFSATLLAHLLIFRDFLKASNTAKVVEGVRKRRWLLAQLVCQLLDWEDPFEEILIAIEWEPLEYINEQLTKVIKDIQILLPESVRTDGFFVAIDEANVAIREIWSSKNSDSGPYPALKEIIRTWRDCLASFEGVPITFVVAGTQIPQSYFPPSSQEWSSWRWTSDTGAFDNPETQKKYVLSFLPPSLVQTPRVQALFRRIWDWCRPRRVTGF
ncbi:hypothetical protein C0993_007907 [Termitomyces sp. T159_Od127]|nr:hypothetical protein C0993_007907 [Termitomyces sp. T159_Od127]